MVPTYATAQYCDRVPEQTRLDQGDDAVTLAAPAAETFANALRAAILASGLGLERIRARLHERGAPLSTATLSYWQSGRSEPARRTSLRALAHLEEILGLPAGALAAHLDRPASTTPETPPLATLSTPMAQLPEWLRRAEARLRSTLSVVSDHVAIRVGPDHIFASRWVRQVLRADAAGADRYVVVHVKHDVNDPEPVFEALTHCRTGSIRRAPELGIVAYEVIFDRALDLGESIIIEYQETLPAGSTTDMEYEIRRRTATRELVIEVNFSPTGADVRCETYQSALDGSGQVVSVALLDSSHSVRLIRHDAAPGRYGVRWSPA